MPMKNLDQMCKATNSLFAVAFLTAMALTLTVQSSEIAEFGDKRKKRKNTDN